MIWRVDLTAVVHGKTVKRSYHTEGNQHTVEDMMEKAGERNISCEMSPVYTHTTKTIIDRFLDSID